MNYKIQNGDYAQGAEHQQKNNQNTTKVGEIENEINKTNDEQVCPISYEVVLYEFQVDSQEKPLIRVGKRTKTFHHQDPFYARQEAMIYATGLETIIENEHQWGGLVFHSEKEIKRRRYRNYNSYTIRVWLKDAEKDRSYIVKDIFDSPCTGLLTWLEDEYWYLQSKDYFTDKVIIMRNEGDVYYCINSMIDLVEFNDTEHTREDLFGEFCNKY